MTSKMSQMKIRYLPTKALQALEFAM